MWRECGIFCGISVAFGSGIDIDIKALIVDCTLGPGYRGIVMSKASLFIRFIRFIRRAACNHGNIGLAHGYTLTMFSSTNATVFTPRV